MKRYMHKCNSEHKTSLDIGLLYPIQTQDVIAGQTTYLETAGLFRFQPMIAPAMVKLNAHIVHFYVPYRLLWDKWFDFISGQETLEIPTTRFKVNPSVSQQLRFALKKTLLDYMGFPTNFDDVKYNSEGADLNINFLPFLAYHRIWNEHFRDESIQEELDLDAMFEEFVAGVTASSLSDNPKLEKYGKLFKLRRVNWGRDRFTKALLETETDPSINLPVGRDGTLRFRTTPGDKVVTIDALATGNYASTFLSNSEALGGSRNNSLMYEAGLQGVDLSDFKLATALYNFKINQNKYGADVEAYFKKYGLKNMDLRLQRSEVIGGFAETMQISDIISTSSDELGKQGGHAVGYAKRKRFKHYAPEHGLIMTMCYLRPKADYAGGVPRYFLKRDMLDFYQAEFADIGYQPIYDAEIGIQKANPILPKDENDMSIFGYEPRYEEYRSETSLVTGEVRPEEPLSHWANPRVWATQKPSLNSNFLECNPSNQIWASPNTDKCIAYFKRNVTKLCFVPKKSDPRIKL